MENEVLVTARLDRDTDQALDRLAQQAGRSKVQLVEDVLRDYVAADARFAAAVEEGLASWRAGELVTHDEVAEGIARRLRPA
jgi:predicted transcriptional regulator